MEKSSCMHEKGQKPHGLTKYKLPAYAGFSWLAAVSVCGVAGYRVTQISMIIPLLTLAAFLTALQFDRNREIKLCKPAICFAAPFALTLVLGSGFDMDEGVFYGYPPLALLWFPVLALFFMMLTANAMSWLNRHAMPARKAAACRHTWLFASGMAFVAWMPYYLTYYPGIVSPDYVEIISQCTGKIPFTNHHPVLFVFFIKIILTPCAKLFGMQTAAAIVTGVHMALFALMLGYMAHWLYRKGAGKPWYGLAVAFIALNPVIAVFSVYMTKDVLFGGIFLLYILLLYDLAQSKAEALKTPKGFGRFLAFSLLLVFLRNNGIYIALAVVAVLLFLYRAYKKRLLLCAALLLLSYGLLKGPAFAALGIAGESFAESMSIPLQQIAQTICDEGEMPKEDAAFLERLLPFETVKEVYVPGYTDPYKFHEAFDDALLNAKKKEFLLVWARLLPYNLDSYMKAYLMQTAGYWHIGESDTLNPYGVVPNAFGIVREDVFLRVAGVSLGPVIEKLILACRKAPIVCFLTNMAFMVFLAYFTGLRLWINEKKQYLLPFLPLFLLWATVMAATPAYCKFRYLLPFHLAYPFMAWAVFCVSGKGGSD